MFDVDKLSDNEKKAIEELRVRVKNTLTPCMLEDSSLFYRFLKARDFDVNEAEKMIQEHLTWRKLHQVDYILEDFTPREFFIKYIQSTIFGFDKEGSLVLYNPSGKLDFRDVSRCVEIHKYMKYWAWYVEKLLKYVKEQNKISGRNHTPMTFILDMDKLALGNATNKKNGWKEKLLEAIDADVLPAFLGGNRTDPDGDPLCKTFVNHGGRIPPEYFLSDEERYFKNKPGVKKISIPKMDKKEVIVDANELESVIRWEFYTKSNINFGLYRRLSDQPPEEVIPLWRYDTSDGTEKDSYKVRIPGQYILVFDNSYSWMTSKDVEYCIQIIRPE